MGFFGGIGNAIKKVGGGAAGLAGLGHGSPPPSAAGSAVGRRTSGWSDAQPIGAPTDAVANENQRALMGSGMSEADAIRASRKPGMGKGFVPAANASWALPALSTASRIGAGMAVRDDNGYGRNMGREMDGSGEARMYPGGSATFDEAAAGRGSEIAMPGQPQELTELRPDLAGRKPWMEEGMYPGGGDPPPWQSGFGAAGGAMAMGGSAASGAGGPLEQALMKRQGQASQASQASQAFGAPEMGSQEFAQ